MNKLAALCFVCALCLFGAGAGRDWVDNWVATTELPALAADTSVEVLDRNGALLRAYTVADGRWRMRSALDEVDPQFIDMLVRFEDKRFWQHGGVDTIAFSRAVGQAIWNGEVVSGGSTLSMQVARLLEESGTGRWRGKMRQIRVAMALEARLSKEDILTLYLNRAPYGGNIEGIRAASLAWLGKPPNRLTPAQSALLIALPQSPETRRPDRNLANAYVARDRVLHRLWRDGMLGEAEIDAAKTESIQAQKAVFPTFAPHLADRAKAQNPLTDRLNLTLDVTLQSSLEALARQAAHEQGARISIAILVADHQSGEVLASVGSAGYRADGREGFVDMTRAVRSPGSTLKPLIYGLAFDRGLAHPETLIADRPTDFDGYAPVNFDGVFRGELPVREALQLSLNIPAVSLTRALAPERLMAAMRDAGAAPKLPSDGAPGLAVALGGVGMTLEDLVRLYGGIARGGEAMDFHWRRGETGQTLPRRIMGEVAAWQVGDILADVPRPRGFQAEGIAFKTGTSYGYRDAWAIGFDGAYVVGVWMGRPDGTPVPGAFGGAVAAPVMFRAFTRLADERTSLPPPPAATLLLSNSALPLPLRRFRPRGDVARDETAPRIDFPPHGAVIEGPDLVARVDRGTAPYTWLVNGAYAGQSRRKEFDLQELGAGFSTLTVIDADGRTARAEFQLK